MNKSVKACCCLVMLFVLLSLLSVAAFAAYSEDGASENIKDHVHDMADWKEKDMYQHVSECEDAECSYKRVQEHLDQDSDFKCDVCDRYFFNNITLERIIGVLFGCTCFAIVLFGVSAFKRRKRY